MNKKANAGIILVIVIIIVIFLVWLFEMSTRECSSNSECDPDNYCGSDHNCHKVPVIEKNVVEHHYTGAALILGVCFIIAAIILRWNPRKHITTHEVNNNLK